MPQKIRFEYEANRVVINTFELETIHLLASEYPTDDLRINSDGDGKLRVHVGDLNVEPRRYWVYTDGRILLLEERVGTDPLAPSWQAVASDPAEPAAEPTPATN